MKGLLNVNHIYPLQVMYFAHAVIEKKKEYYNSENVLEMLAKQTDCNHHHLHVQETC